MMPGGSEQDLKLLGEVKKGFVENVINGDDYQKSKYISSIAMLFVPGSGELKALEVGADVTNVKDVATAIDEVSKGEKFLSEADKGIEGIKDVDGVEKVGQLENAAGDNIISLGDVRNEKTLEGISEDESFETGARVVNGEDIANLSSIISSVDAKVAALDKSIEGLEDLKPLEKVDGIDGVSNAELSQSKIDEIVSLPKGERPDPSTYLSKEFMDTHLSQFDDGLSVIQTEWAYGRYSETNGFVGVPDDNTLFVLPKKYCDGVVSRANGDISIIENELGFPKGYFGDGGGLVRIDVDDVTGLNLRLPSGNETGATSLWIPGGYTSGNVPEAISDIIPLNQTTISRINVD